MNNQNMIELKNISAGFENGKEYLQVFNDFSLTFPRGDMNIILGPTGCGKSTLLNLIAGIVSIQSGTLDFSEPGLQKKTRFVFQHYTLFPWLNIIQNIEFGLKVKKIEKFKRHEMAESMLNAVGLASFEKHFPHELSGGMRQRAAIAQALVTEPVLLLMDEPFGALDDFTRMELQEFLKTIHNKNNITTIFVTHSIDEAIKLGDRIILLSKRPAEIIQDIRPVEKQTAKEKEALYAKLRQQLHHQFMQ